MSIFLKNNLVSGICMLITIAGIFINIGMYKSELATLKTDVAELKTTGTPLEQRNAASISELEDYKKESKDKIKDIETLARQSNDKLNDKLDSLNSKVAVVVSWIEDQKHERK